MARDRSGDADRTQRRRIDVDKAFRDARSEEARGEVAAVLPADAIPVLAVPRAEIPWPQLDELSTKLLLRIDGATSCVDLVDASDASPDRAAQALASLAQRGLVRLVLRLDPAGSGPEGGSRE